jgi:hypothetical protein
MLVSSNKPIKWKNIDNRLDPHEITLTNPSDTVYCFLQIPPHKPFTEIIVAIAKFDELGLFDIVIENVAMVTGEYFFITCLYLNNSLNFIYYSISLTILIFLATIGVKFSINHPNDLNPILDIGANLITTYQHPGYGDNLLWYNINKINIGMIYVVFSVGFI